MSVSPVLYPTSVPGLDDVLGGGFAPGSLVFFVGTPGAGKTILASQIVFNSARQGLQTLIFTAFSEGTTKLVGHLQDLAFFESKLIGDKVTIFSLPSTLGEDSVDAARRIMQTVREVKAHVVVLDGFQGIMSMLGSQDMMRRTLAEIASMLSFLDIIVIVTFEARGRDSLASVALTTADTVIGLEYGVANGRHIRHLDVIKQRGSAPLAGLHSYTITGDGVTIYPRVELLPLGDIPPFTSGRAAFGLPELDELLHGGIMSRTTTILAGAPGVGKTTLGLYWGLAEATPEAATLFVSFGEYLEQIRFKAAAFNLDFETAHASGAFIFERLSPVDIVPDIVATTILAAMTPNITRLVVDDVAGLLFILGDRAGVFLTALAAQCYQRGITTMFLLEIEAMAGLRINLANTALSLVSENVILLQQVIAAGRMHRVLAVLKTRFSAFDQTLREVIMDENGVRVLTPGQTAIGVLDEGARVAGGFSPRDLSHQHDPGRL